MWWTGIPTEKAPGMFWGGLDSEIFVKQVRWLNWKALRCLMVLYMDIGDRLPVDLTVHDSEANIHRVVLNMPI